MDSYWNPMDILTSGIGSVGGVGGAVASGVSRIPRPAIVPQVPQAPQGIPDAVQQDPMRESKTGKPFPITPVTQDTNPLKDPANTASAINAVNAVSSGLGAIGSAINTQDLASSYNDSLRAEESRALALSKGVPDIMESAPTLNDYQVRARNEQERRAGEGIKTGASMAGVGATIGGAIAAGAAGGSAATPIGTIIGAVVGLLAGVGMAIGGGVKRRRLAREENEATQKEVQSKFESDLRAWNSKRDNYVTGLQNTYSQERGKKQQAEDANQLARDLSGTTAQINTNKGLIDVGANPLTRLSQMPARKMDSASPILITGSRG